jgi:glutaminase
VNDTSAPESGATAAVLRDGAASLPLGTFVSTGDLPEPARVRRLVEEAHALYRDNVDGENATVYPALARAPSELFGICSVSTGGEVTAVGDAEHEFTLMSVAKPFTFALVCERLGADRAAELVGTDATGLAFDSLEAIERGQGRTNPMVNAGAIVAASLVPDAPGTSRWETLRTLLSRFAGRELTLDDEVYACARETNFRNRSMTALLHSYGVLHCDPDTALDLYTRQSALRVTARDLAVMGATLAAGGVNPVTRERVVGARVCHHVLAAMITAGMYETSGEWLYQVGLPAKSGIGGGIVTVSPGKGGLGTFAPRLDRAGNSVKGQLVARHLSAGLGLDLLISEPVRDR